MPKRSSKPTDEDLNETAFRIMQTAVTADSTGRAHDATLEVKQAAARILGSLGGQKGGPARAKALSASRRSAIAKKAAKARWNK